LAHIAQRVAVPDSAVEVWRVPLTVSEPESEQLAMLLSRDEQLLAARFQFARDRKRYIAARGMLRVLLGKHLDVSPAAVAFESGPHGKPQLADSSGPVNFNLSHSGDLAICALARDCLPGVDIESLDRTIDYDALARRFFSAREFAELQLIPCTERNRAFLACWTCKEAVAKAIGLGLSLPLDRIEVAVDPDAPPQVLSVAQGDPREWKLYRINADRAYVATLALCRPL
jgi:4'-phosphopantetheinyl transferase